MPVPGGTATGKRRPSEGTALRQRVQVPRQVHAAGDEYGVRPGSEGARVEARAVESDDPAFLEAWIGAG